MNIICIRVLWYHNLHHHPLILHNIIKQMYNLKLTQRHGHNYVQCTLHCCYIGKVWQFGPVWNLDQYCISSHAPQTDVPVVEKSVYKCTLMYTMVTSTYPSSISLLPIKQLFSTCFRTFDISLIIHCNGSTCRKGWSIDLKYFCYLISNYKVT